MKQRIISSMDNLLPPTFLNYSKIIFMAEKSCQGSNRQKKIAAAIKLEVGNSLKSGKRGKLIKLLGFKAPIYSLNFERAAFYKS